MNVLRKSVFKTSNKLFTRNYLNTIYSILTKGKFRRAIQPGLTRYNNDEYDHQSGSMNVSNTI